MSEPVLLRHVRPAELELLRGKVIDEGGELRLLSRSDHGLGIVRGPVAGR